ncbi:MAG: ribonuclease J, partial [Monoglobales bacterium]
GSLPYLLKEINVPVYGTRLTLGLVECKLKEHGILSTSELICVHQGDKIKIGNFGIEFIHSNHSIPDAVMLAISTPVGTVIHTGDFKIDPTPISGSMIDLGRLGELGKKGVLALLSDSTNVENPGYTLSESKVGVTFDEIFANHKNSRIIVATFASNVHRIQQLINSTVKYGRKLAVSGRSMENIVEVASLLGYIDIPKGTLISIDEIKKYQPHQLVICTTGSQGEAMSALTRMSTSDHKKVEIVKGDLIVISANPIPGNETSVSKVVDDLFKRGAEVFYESSNAIHVSGHACQEELKIILGITKPKYFVPMHGEYRHLIQHANLGEQMGVNPDNVFVMGIGQMLEFSADEAKLVSTVPSGRILVDGLGVGDVGNIVLRDRQHLAQDGLIVIVISVSQESGTILGSPDVISRGFVYVRESEELMDEIREVVAKAFRDAKESGVHDWSSLKLKVKQSLSSYLYSKTKRSPMLLPIIVEV